MTQDARSAIPPAWALRLINTAITLFVLYLSLGIPISVTRDILTSRDLDLNGQKLLARIGDVYTCPSKPAPVVCWEVIYSVKGKTYISRNALHGLATGQERQIIYAPLDPAVYRFDLPQKPPPWDQGLWGRIVITLSLSLIFGATSWQILKAQWLPEHQQLLKRLLAQLKK